MTRLSATAAKSLREVEMVWYVAIGSAVGGALRFLLGGLVQERVGVGFPIGTLAVNVLGSLALGFLLRYALDTPTFSPEARALLTTGLCGGFTTFSAFAYETVALLEDGDWGRAVAYVGLSVVLSLVALAAGLAFARLAVGWQARL